MSNILASSATAERMRITRPQLVSLLGPLISAGGIVWAILQPDRVTLLHPFHQGFWWLVAEPPLLVVLVGIVFAILVAKPLLRDLEEHGGAAR
jgi:hypothetical protein